MTVAIANSDALTLSRLSAVDRFELVRRRGLEALQGRRHQRPQGPQRGVGAGEMRRAGRQLSAGLPRGVAHEQPGALHRARGDARPGAAPGQVRHRHHGARMNALIGLRQDLLTPTGRLELEPGAASAAHAERVPADEPLERVVFLQEHHQHLV
jgi:hypothetical protein